MFRLCVSILLLHVAFSLDIPCKDGEEIKSEVMKDYKAMVGKWTYIYHWDSENKFEKEFANDDKDGVLKCPEIDITEVSQEFVKKLEDKCSKDKLPFKWEDARLLMNAEAMDLKDSLVVIGEKENWMVVDCDKMIRVGIKKVSDDVIIMINPDIAHISEMLTRKPIVLDELKCLAHNIDVGKGMNGIALCY